MLILILNYIIFIGIAEADQISCLRLHGKKARWVFNVKCKNVILFLGWYVKSNWKYFHKRFIS
jgi:hypothetical protein